MVLPEAFLGDATRRVPTGSPLGSSRALTHNTDARIVHTLVGGWEVKFFGSAEVAGRSFAECEHRRAQLRGEETAAAPTASKERRDRRKKKVAKAEQGKETREAQAAQATTMATSEHDDEDE
jgi:hypothetical protein